MRAVEAGGLVVGVISDTHDHLYAEVKKRLVGVDHIIHAGDVCSRSLLTELRAIAALTVVRGNCDLGAWAHDLPTHTEVELGGVRILVGHMGGSLRRAAAARAGAASPDVVVFGHSHQALLEWQDGVLYLNPGAAGPRRFGRPRTMAYLYIAPQTATQPGARPGAVEDHPVRVSADIVVVER